MTTFREVGEKDFVRQVLSRYASTARTELVDDCVVIDCATLFDRPGLPCLVYSVDHPGQIDRPLGTLSRWRYLGRWAAACTCGDVLAMGARPRGFSVDLSIPGDFAVESVTEIYQGFADVLHEYGTEVEGGNVDVGIKPEIVAMAWGLVDPASIIRRSGARVGDCVAVTTELGLGWASFVLRRTGRFDELPSAVRRRLADYHLLPLAPHEAIVRTATTLPGALTSGMDLTDGLVEFAYTVREKTGLGVRLEEAGMPASPDLSACARLLDVPAGLMGLEQGFDTPAAHGYTVDPARWDEVAGIFAECGATLHRVGEVTAEPEISWRTNEGDLRALPPFWDDQASRDDVIGQWLAFVAALR